MLRLPSHEFSLRNNRALINDLRRKVNIKSWEYYCGAVQRFGGRVPAIALNEAGKISHQRECSRAGSGHIVMPMPAAADRMSFCFEMETTFILQINTRAWRLECLNSPRTEQRRAEGVRIGLE